MLLQARECRFAAAPDHAVSTPGERTPSIRAPHGPRPVLPAGRFRRCSVQEMPWPYSREKSLFYSLVWDLSSAPRALRNGSRSPPEAVAITVIPARRSRSRDATTGGAGAGVCAPACVVDCRQETLPQLDVPGNLCSIKRLIIAHIGPWFTCQIAGFLSASRP